jgi:hypothetical protein
MLKKTPMSYFKNNGIIALKKNVDVNHGLIAKKLKKVNNNLKGPMERALANKRSMVNGNAISNFFGIMNFYN